MTADMAAWPEKTTLASHQARFEALVAEHRGIAFKVANAYAREAEDRKDLIQEIVTQTWRAFPYYDEGRRFSTWMYRIALNVAISRRRAETTRARHLPSDPSVTLEALPGSSGAPDDRIRELYRVIDALDDLHKALVVLYLEGHDQREMAEILGLTETNVATRLSRLRQRLRHDLAPRPAPSGGDRGTR
jgi:RNA polymerase sigma-70 factor (ECF subfamily)